MHEYTVELRIYGSDLNITSITEQLRLEPSLVRNIGDRRSESSQWEEAMWAYNGFPESIDPVTWPSLERGLSFVLDKLWPVKDILQTYKGLKVILWCGHFQTDSNASTTLSLDILKRLGEFGVELFIDNYCSIESEETTRSDAG
jgi:hypothetical protein